MVLLVFYAVISMVSIIASSIYMRKLHLGWGTIRKLFARGLSGTMLGIVLGGMMSKFSNFDIYVFTIVYFPMLVLVVFLYSVHDVTVEDAANNST